MVPCRPAVGLEPRPRRRTRRLARQGAAKDDRGCEAMRTRSPREPHCPISEVPSVQSNIAAGRGDAPPVGVACGDARRVSPRFGSAASARPSHYAAAAPGGRLCKRTGGSMSTLGATRVPRLRATRSEAATALWECLFWDSRSMASPGVPNRAPSERAGNCQLTWQVRSADAQRVWRSRKRPRATLTCRSCRARAPPGNRSRRQEKRFQRKCSIRCLWMSLFA